MKASNLIFLDETWTALRPLSNAFGAAECANYFRHAGYFQSA
jgi:hypothetical protein